MKTNPQQLEGRKRGAQRANFGKYLKETMRVVGKPAVMVAASVGLALAPCSSLADKPKKGKAAQEKGEKKALQVKELKENAAGIYEKIIMGKEGFHIKAAHKNPIQLENTKVKASVSAVVSHVEGFLSYVLVTLKGPGKKELPDPTSYDGEKQAVDQKFIVDLAKLEKALGKELEAVHLVLNHMEGTAGFINPFSGEMMSQQEMLEIYVIPGTEQEVKGWKIAGGMPVLLLTVSKNPKTGKYEIGESMEYVTSSGKWGMPNPGIDSIEVEEVNMYK